MGIRVLGLAAVLAAALGITFSGHSDSVGVLSQVTRADDLASVSRQAITVTHLGAAESRPLTAAPTPSFPIPAGHLALIWIATDLYDATGDPIRLDDVARTWTKVASKSLPRQGLTLWQSLALVDTNSPVTVHHSVPTRSNWVANYYSATIVRQVATGASSPPGREFDSGSVVFPRRGSDGAVAAAFTRSSVPPSTVVAAPEFALTGDEVSGLEMVNRTMFSPQSQPTVSLAWSHASAWIGIAVEIAGPVSAAAPTPPASLAPRPGETPLPAAMPRPDATPAPASYLGGFSRWDLAGALGVAAVLGLVGALGGIAVLRRRGS